MLILRHVQLNHTDQQEIQKRQYCNSRLTRHSASFFKRRACPGLSSTPFLDSPYDTNTSSKHQRVSKPARLPIHTRGLILRYGLRRRTADYIREHANPDF